MKNEEQILFEVDDFNLTDQLIDYMIQTFGFDDLYEFIITLREHEEGDLND